MKVSLSSLIMMIAATLAVVGCTAHGNYNLPPAERLAHPGPGVDGPGPGVDRFPTPPMGPGPGGPGPVTPASAYCPIPFGGAGMGGGVAQAQSSSSQVLFSKPEGMQIRWDVGAAGQFDSEPLIVPGRQNFPRGGIYRIKLTNIPNREGVELYPTLEIGPTTARSEAFLSHNAIPIQITEDDFDQVVTGNFVTKVIYLPDREFQEQAIAGVDTLVSTRLEPGVDPVVEADRRGVILAILRLGNKDLSLVSGMEEMQPAPGQPIPLAGGGAPHGIPPNYVSGVTGPQWGMATSGTPIGLPGPPHIPFGGQAGLQKHVMRNHTSMHIPDPNSKLRIDVRQRPGLSYPRPPHRVSIHENTIHPTTHHKQPLNDGYQVIE